MARGTILLAEVDRARGLIGEVVARLHADDPERLDSVDEVEIVLRGAEPRRARLEGWKRRGERVVLKLSGIDSVDEARALAGAEIRIPSEDSPDRAPEGSYFAHQLEGARVKSVSGEELGRVISVATPAGQSLLEIDGPRGRFTVPLAGAICVKIDVDRGEIVIDPPEGLIELNAV